MKNKYIHFIDVDEEISKSFGLIDTLEKEIVREKRRIEYLKVLMNYLEHHGICPFTKKELLENDVKLQDYVTPLIAKLSIVERQRFIDYIKLSYQEACNDSKKIKYKVKFEYKDNKYLIMRNVDFSDLKYIFEYNKDKVLPKITIEKEEENGKL